MPSQFTVSGGSVSGNPPGLFTTASGGLMLGSLGCCCDEQSPCDCLSDELITPTVQLFFPIEKTVSGPPFRVRGPGGTGGSFIIRIQSIEEGELINLAGNLSCNDCFKDGEEIGNPSCVVTIGNPNAFSCYDTLEACPFPPNPQCGELRKISSSCNPVMAEFHGIDVDVDESEFVRFILTFHT